MLTELNAGGDLAGAVRYAEISTRNDVIVTPVSSQVPDGPADPGTAPCSSKTSAPVW